jgi:hypothetical protein
MLAQLLGVGLHRWVGHHHETDAPCSVEAGLPHFHAPEHAHGSCDLCDFVLTAATEPPCLAWQLPMAVRLVATTPPAYLAPVGIQAISLPDLRGPPAPRTAA